MTAFQRVTELLAERQMSTSLMRLHLLLKLLAPMIALHVFFSFFLILLIFLCFLLFLHHWVLYRFWEC